VEGKYDAWLRANPWRPVWEGRAEYLAKYGRTSDYDPRIRSRLPPRALGTERPVMDARRPGEWGGVAHTPAAPVGLGGVLAPRMGHVLDPRRTPQPERWAERAPIPRRNSSFDSAAIVPEGEMGPGILQPVTEIPGQGLLMALDTRENSPPLIRTEGGIMPPRHHQKSEQGDGPELLRPHGDGNGDSDT